MFSFLNPFMLFGITAIAVPIIIHLLNKRKYEKVVWAAMRFLKLSTEQNQRRLRIEDLLLLILRCALLVILALALARPTVRSAAAGLFGGGNVTAVIALDNSYSMSGNDGVSSRFDNAKKAADQILDSLPGGSSVAVLLASDSIDAAIPQPTYDLNLARKTIDEAKLTDRSTNLFPAFRTAFGVLKKKATGRREFYLVTDGELNGWSQLPDIRKALDDTRDDIVTHLIFVGPDVKENLAVTDLKTSGDLSPADRPQRFETAVTNFGATEAKGVRVQLKIDAEATGPKEAGDLSAAPVDETTIDSIPAGESRVVSLFGKLRGAGAHGVAVNIAADHLPADDSRSIVVRGLAKVKILIIDGDLASPTAKSGAFFVRHALLPIPSMEIPNYFLAVTTASASEMDTLRFDDYDTVFAVNVSDFDNKTVEALTSYVKNGGGLVIFPGSNTTASTYNQELHDHSPLLPATLGEVRGEAGQEEKFITLQAKNFEHPIAAIWNDPASGSPAAAHFYRSFTLQPIAPSTPAPTTAPSSTADVVLRYADNSPAVMEQPLGMGRVVLFSSSADSSWNDLAVRPGIFVPLIYRVVGSIVARQDEALNIDVGQPFVYRPPIESLGREVNIVSPSGGKDTRKVELRDASAVVDYEDTSLGGTYDVTIAGDSPINLKFAAQPDKNESRLEMLADSDMHNLADAAQVVRWTPGAQLDQSIRTARAGTELWSFLALAVLALAVAEPFLGNWFSRSK
jgi:Aerotolerance regulator N-terminal/von Willebrand factor type A domain